MSERTCSIDGCEKEVRARGWCSTHHQRWRLHGDPNHEGYALSRDGVCSIEGCERPIRSRRLCGPHYKQAQYAAAKQAEHPKRGTCAVCQSEFTMRRAGMKYCSDACWKAAVAARERAKRSEGRKWSCDHCGADISRKRADAKFCSDACANQAEYKANLRRNGKTKVCPRCRQEKSAASFHRNKARADGLAVYCKECWIPIGKARPKRNRDVSLRGNRKRRELVLTLYGGSCACCGEDRFEFLTIDHVNGDGAAHRREVRYANIATYLHVVWNQEGRILDGFRVLCWNCNCTRGVYGYCPHERESDDGTDESSESSAWTTQSQECSGS